MSCIGEEGRVTVDLGDELDRGIRMLIERHRNEIAHTGEQIREELEGIKKILQEISNRQEHHLYPYGR